MADKPDADAIFRALYECTDPECTATHVIIDNLTTTAVFSEEYPGRMHL